MTGKQATRNSIAKILLVEDHRLSRLLLNDYLNHLGYEVLSLEDSQDFFLIVNQFQPQLILLDLKLPGEVDGYKLLYGLQQHEEWSKIPVFVVSALAFQADQHRAFALGARRYFIKPVNLQSLISLIEQELFSP